MGTKKASVMRLTRLRDARKSRAFPTFNRSTGEHGMLSSKTMHKKRSKAGKIRRKNTRAVSDRRAQTAALKKSL
jgi:hypothetical protein